MNKQKQNKTIKTKKHKHNWLEIFSYGATVGFDAKCSICGKIATFTPRD
jgi:hypothetical protein